MNPNVREYFIQGITKEGKTFRPSDWAERLCGVMAQFRPEGDSGDPRLTYSPYVRPIFAGNVNAWWSMCACAISNPRPWTSC